MIETNALANHYSKIFGTERRDSLAAQAMHGHY